MSGGAKGKIFRGESENHHKSFTKRDRMTIEEFKEWHDNRHEYAKHWKKENPDGMRWIYFPSPDG